MDSDGILKHLAFAFVIALVFYAAGYSWIEHRREVKGPWEVTFTREEDGAPSLIVNQPTLKISNLKLVFPDRNASELELPQSFSFAQPLPRLPYEMPFGNVIFFDTTFLPGTVTFDLFTHEIELLPRVLIINKREYPWRSDAVIAVSGEGVAGQERPKGLAPAPRFDRKPASQE